MNSLEANIRDNSTKGQLNTIRNSGNVPAIIYGGKDQNQKVSISKKLLKILIEKENFLSNIIILNVNGLTILADRSIFGSISTSSFFTEFFLRFQSLMMTLPHLKE